MQKDQMLLEERFVFDYFKFSININLYGVAPYLKIIESSIIDLPKGNNKLLLTDDIQKAIAINVHRSLNESYENLAIFLQALIARKEKDLPLHEYLAATDINKAKNIPAKSKSKNADAFLEFHGLPSKEAELNSIFQPGSLYKMKRVIRKRVSFLLKKIAEAQAINSDLYNTTKHGKSWISSTKYFMGDPSAPDTPLALIIEEGSTRTRHVSINHEPHFILQDIYIIQGIAALLRDLVLLFSAKYYPETTKKILEQKEPQIITANFDKELKVIY